MGTNLAEQKKLTPALSTGEKPKRRKPMYVKNVKKLSDVYFVWRTLLEAPDSSDDRV